jgi:hypothetical protein
MTETNPAVTETNPAVTEIIPARMKNYSIRR